jgi:NADH dehydrogenase
MSDRHHVVIVGGGFGGLSAALALKNIPVQVTLIDRRNFHLFQPLLYQVATGALSPANIAAPLRNVLRRQKNARVILGEVSDIDVAGRCVVTRDSRIAYDSLIVATGARHTYFGHDDWERIAPGLKTVEDATEIRGRILSAFEMAEREPDSQAVATWLTFVVVGGGPTGVELAGALGEIARDTLRHEFRSIRTDRARIVLVEALDRVLTTYPPELSSKAERALRRLGVEVRTGCMVADVQPESVTLQCGGRTEQLRTRTVLWAAGVQASPLGRRLADAIGAKPDRAGRILVEPDLTLPGHPEILVIGDLANYSHQTGGPLPGVAPVAMQQGNYVARLIGARLRGMTLRPFRYRNYGNLATVGRSAAVADFGRIRFNGFAAWVTWLFVHLMKLVRHENRVLVFVQWAFNYFTRNRSARLITGESAPGEQTRE